MVKPLKAPNNILPFDQLPFELDLVSSPKKDGLRGLCIDGKLHTSSMKTPRNILLPIFLKPLIDLSIQKNVVFDYELFDPEATHHATLAGTINSYCNSLPPKLLCLVFDAIYLDDFYLQSIDFAYAQRIILYHHLLEGMPKYIRPLPQRPINNISDVATWFNYDLEHGDEGSIIRATKIIGNQGGWYKHGRATHNQGIIFKVKNFTTLEGTIINVEPRRRLKSGLTRTYDCCGHLEHINNLNAYEETDILGAFWVYVTRDDGTTFSTKISFGKGFSIDQRKKLWEQRESLIGKIVEFSHMPHGAKLFGGCRHGRLLNFRED